MTPARGTGDHPRPASACWAASRPSTRRGRPSEPHYHQAAVDGEDLAGDEGGLVGGEERDGAGNLLGRSELAERRLGVDLVLEHVDPTLSYGTK
jgi:hypothetical protein